MYPGFFRRNSFSHSTSGVQCDHIEIATLSLLRRGPRLLLPLKNLFVPFRIIHSIIGPVRHLFDLVLSQSQRETNREVDQPN